jgi:hypothetical protein
VRAVDALIRSVTDLFASHHRYSVPAYQRSYVWNEGDQWLPLWEDVERVADRRLQGNDDHHFLGAIVIRVENTPPGGVTDWSVIDGQQRLTTLQLLMSALADAARADGHPKEARRLERLVFLDEDDAEGDSRFKFWPTTVNRSAFREIMREGGPDPQGNDDPTNTVHEAWAFFRARAEEYVHADAADADEVLARHQALNQAVTGLLQIVTISLDRDDPAQVIFETLNARGTPLLAMDLVKNALFDAAERQGHPVEKVNDEIWHPELGDHAYWGAEQRLGRVTVPRSEGFLMHWLAMHEGAVIPADRLFELFRSRILRNGSAVDALELIRTLNADARVLRAFEDYPPGTSEHRFFRALRWLDTTTMHPVALLLFRSPLEPNRRDRALRAIESYMVRRMLRGLSTKNYSQLAARLVSSALRDVMRADEFIVEELLDSQADTYRWPTDAELSEHLASQPLYGWLGQRRIVFVLSSLEIAGRVGKTEAIPSLPPHLEVEHVMPRAWRAAWPLSKDGDDAEQARDGRLNLLGNLTLVTKPLNASMSNSAWGTKREALDQSLLILNRDLCKLEVWDDAAIGRRGDSLRERIVDLWRGPQEFMPPGWSPREAESWPESASMPLEDVARVYGEGSGYLRAMLDELASTPGVRRRFPAVEEALGWPRGRLAGVCGGYATKYRDQLDGRRPWHIHLDADGAWWMWMDPERAALVAAQP